MSGTEKLSPELQQTIEIMLRAGASVAGIERELGVSRNQITRLAQFRRATTFSTQLNAKDQELADGLRKLANQALQKAEETLQFGSPSDQAVLVRAIIGRSMALIGAEKTSKLDDLRAEFEEFIGASQAGEEIEFDLPEDIIDLAP